MTKNEKALSPSFAIHQNGKAILLLLPNVQDHFQTRVNMSQTRVNMYIGPGASSFSVLGLNSNANFFTGRAASHFMGRVLGNSIDVVLYMR
jgi:hypothetical protein